MQCNFNFRLEKRRNGRARPKKPRTLIKGSQGANDNIAAEDETAENSVALKTKTAVSAIGIEDTTKRFDKNGVPNNCVQDHPGQGGDRGHKETNYKNSAIEIHHSTVRQNTT